MFTPHMAATSTISATRACMAAICGGWAAAGQSWTASVPGTWYLVPYLVQDGGVGGQHAAVLDEAHADPPGRPQLLLRGVEPATLQLKVALTGSFQGAGGEIQSPAQIQVQEMYISSNMNHVFSFINQNPDYDDVKK